MRTSQTVLTPDKIFSGVKKSENALMPLIRLRVFKESVKLRTTCVKAYIEEIANERVKSTEEERNNEKHGAILNETKSNN